MERVPYVIIGGGLAATAAIDAIRRRDKTGAFGTDRRRASPAL